MAPWRAVLQHPIKQCTFKSYIASGFITLNPFVAEDFIPFGKEFSVQRRVLEKITAIR